MAIDTRTSIGKSQVVLPKHDVEAAGFAGHSKQESRREQARRRQKDADSQPLSNHQGQVAGTFIDVTV
ncbi:MAG: hypothetical protein WCV99_05120 [Sterolibacterium sp.]|jgi:hypothetical protein